MNKLKDYSHAWYVFIYGIFYMICFALLEKRSYPRINIIHMKVDDAIPFCEYFIVPYLLWFAFVALTVLYFTFVNQDKKEYYQLICSLAVGMTIFLLVSFFFPNGQTLRPTVFPRENIFTDMVRYLYMIDTPTNILPSIHVFNTIACLTAIMRSPSLYPRKGLIAGTNILSILIVLSTLFLKQHSMIDVLSAFLLNMICYQLFYAVEPEHSTVKRRINLKA